MNDVCHFTASGYWICLYQDLGWLGHYRFIAHLLKVLLKKRSHNMEKAIKIFDTSHEESSLEEAINQWLSENSHIQVISTNFVWDDSNLSYSILYSKQSLEIPG